MSNLETSATRMAARVDSSQFGMDPITIAALLLQVLPLVVQCFHRNDINSPDFIRADVPMTKEQSFLLAEAVIEETLASGDDVVYGVAVECGCDQEDF